MATRPEAILYSILDRCSVAGGCSMDPANPVIHVFLRRGLLAVCDDGTVETTAKAVKRCGWSLERARNNSAA